MGSSFSQLEPSQNKTCLICWETIHFMELVQCYQCNIQLHTYCEETYRGGKNCCKCPHCQQRGTLGTS
jgi:hypothetical protein